MNIHIFSTYSGWKKSCTGWYVTVYPIIIGFQTFGGAGIGNHPQYFWSTTLLGRCFFSQKLNYLNDPNEIQLLGSCPDQLVTTNLANGDSNGWPLMTLWTLRALDTRSMVSFCPLKTSFKGTSKTHGGPAGSWGLTQQKKPGSAWYCWLQGLGIGSTGPDAYEFQGWHGMLAAKDCNQFLGAQQFCWENSQKCHGNPQGVHPC